MLNATVRAVKKKKKKRMLCFWKVEMHFQNLLRLRALKDIMKLTV